MGNGLRLSSRLIKNAASNVARGGATAVINLAIPHFLTQSLDVDRFSAWSLMLQIAAYSSFLDFGLQTAVARFVAQMTEMGQLQRRRQLMETVLCFMLALTVVGILIIGGVIAAAPMIFKHLPLGMLGEFRTAGMILGCGTALQLAFSPFTGALVGIHRNEIPAFATIASRIVGAAAAIALANHTHRLVLPAIAIAGTNIAAGLIQMAYVRSLIPDLRRLKLEIDRKLGHELLQFCAGLAALTLGMFLIQGMDVTIVGLYRFEAVGYYSIAAAPIAILVGLGTAILSAFLAPLAVLHARQEFDRVITLTLNATWIMTLVNLLAVVFFAWFGKGVLTLWVGHNYALRADPILMILLIAQTIRLVTSPLMTSLVAAGLHSHAILSGLLEGVVNLAASVYLVHKLGAIGVAYGTLIGAAISVIVHMAYTLPKAQQIRIGPKALLISGLGLPLFGMTPLLLLSAVEYIDRPVLHGFVVLSVCLIATLMTVWSWHIQRSSVVTTPQTVS
jgi:O-antigen/teichoic acid export membrane protein